MRHLPTAFCLGSVLLGLGACGESEPAVPAPTGAPVTVVYPFVLEPTRPSEPTDEVALDPAPTPSEGLGLHGTGRGGS